VNGFPGTAYPSVQAERNEVFVPLVSAVISVVLHFFDIFKSPVTNLKSQNYNKNMIVSIRNDPLHFIQLDFLAKLKKFLKHFQQSRFIMGKKYFFYLQTCLQKTCAVLQ